MAEAQWNVKLISLARNTKFIDYQNTQITVKANNLYITYVGRTTENRFSAQETTATNTTITTTPTSYQQPIYKIIVSNIIVYKLSTYHYS